MSDIRVFKFYPVSLELDSLTKVGMMLCIMLIYHLLHILALQFSACIRHQQVVTEKYGSVQMIAINRPEKRNAVDPSTAEELYKAFKQFEKDETMTAAVLYGKG